MFKKREWKLHGDKVLLVPYSPHHVKKYHGWMEDALLRAQTASERLTLEQEHAMQQSWFTSEDNSMAGDVNLFITQEGEEGEIGDGETASEVVAEIDIMIAEPACRGKGFGVEASTLMLTYGARELGIRRFRAKIAFENKASISLFENKLGFKEVSRSNAFNEVTLEKVVEVDKWPFTGEPALKWEKYEPRLSGNET